MILSSTDNYSRTMTDEIGESSLADSTSSHTIYDSAARDWLRSHGFSVSRPLEPRPGDLFSQSAMVEAAAEGTVSMMNWLLNRCSSASVADLLVPDLNGNTPVFWAAKNGHVRALEWLLAHGAAPTVAQPDRFGITPLYIACAERCPRPAIAKVLILRGGMAEEEKGQVTRSSFTRCFGRGTCPAIKAELAAWARACLDVHDRFVVAMMALKRRLSVDAVTAAALNELVADYTIPPVKRGRELRFLLEFNRFFSASEVSNTTAARRYKEAPTNSAAADAEPAS